MRFKLTALAAYMAVIPAHALDVEIGAGLTSYQAQHDGAWYQDGLPHTFDLESESLSIGISHHIGKYRVRAEFLNLGNMYNQAQVVSENLYNPGMDYYSGTHYYLLGRGSISGVLLALQKQGEVFGVPVFAEAGIYGYKNKFKVSVFNESGKLLTEFEREDVTLYRPMIGLGVRFDSFEIGARYFYLDVSSESDAVTPLQTGAFNFMFKAVF